MTGRFAAFLLLLLPLAVSAAEPAVFRLTAEGGVERFYPKVYQALEEEGFYVVFEADIGGSLSRFAERWGEDYNRSGLSAIRSMVFCNGWYANAVSNADPVLLAMCPLRMTLVEKDGRTTALFARPTAVAAGSAALPIFQRIEREVIGAIRKGMGG